MAADSNIVGYTMRGLVANQKAISGAQFVEVGDIELDIASIKLENVAPDGSASIQWWNGSAYEAASWIGLDWDDENPGWGDENTDEIKHSFAVSEGFWVMLPGGVVSPQVKISNKVKVL